MDERYTGTMVYNRTTQKLKTPSRANPKDEWIRTPESFERIIEPAVFARAQQIFAERARVHTPAYMLEKLETLYQSHGILRSSLVRAAPDMPSPSTYVKHFGSMDSAFQRLFNQVRTEAGSRVTEHIEALVEAGGRLRGLLGHRPETHRPRSTFRADALRACQLLVFSARPAGGH